MTDHLYGLELDYRWELAVLHRDMDVAAALIEHLLPVREQLAGAAYASRPLAHGLGDLYRLVGAEQAAAEHYALAERIARAWDSPHLVADARRSAADLAATRARRRTVVT